MQNIIKGLLLVYLLSFSKHYSKLLPINVDSFINENRYIQHILGLLGAIILISLIEPRKSTLEISTMGFIIYLLFLLSTKIEPSLFIGLLLMLVIVYFIEYSFNRKELRIQEDENVDGKIKKQIKNKNKIRRIYMISFVSIIILTGIVLAINKKQTSVQQGGGEFDILRFLLEK